MVDFFTFKSFISTEALIIFYYIGAVVSPIILWFIFSWFIHKYQIFNDLYQSTKESLWKRLSIKNKILFILFFIIAFLFMQLFWRMLFEFLIAYMQIRDALLATS